MPHRPFFVFCEENALVIAEWEVRRAPNTRGNIVEILCSLDHDDGCTVIMVTHDPAVAEQADVVLQMKDGSWI